MRRARLARQSPVEEARREKKRQGAPGPGQSNVPRLCRCGRGCSAACRARRFRAAHPELRAQRKRQYRAAALREDPAIVEHRAQAYVRRALARATVVPPRVCDHCFTPSAQLSPFHPDPRKPRQIAWLCEQHRRTFPAVGGPISLGWIWPGVAGDVPMPWWRVPIERPWIDAANAAVAAQTVDGRMHDNATVRHWADVLFEQAPAALRERVYSLARRGRLETGDPRLTAILEWWAKVEVEARKRRAHNEREELEIEVAVEPRIRGRRRDADVELRSIGNMALPPEAVGAPPPARSAAPRRSDEEIMASVDASLAEVDAILARFEQRKKERS